MMKKNVSRVIAMVLAGVMVSATPTVIYAEENEENAVMEMEMEEKEEPRIEDPVEPEAPAEAPAAVEEIAEEAVREEEMAEAAQAEEGHEEAQADHESIDDEASQEAAAPESGEAASESEEAAAEDGEALQEETTDMEETEEEAEDEIAQFTGFVHVQRKGSGDIYEGDSVTLECVYSDTELLHEIRWEVKEADTWSVLSQGSASEYTFTVDAVNAGASYRAVLVFAEESVENVISNEMTLPALAGNGSEEAAEELVELEPETEMTVCVSSTACDTMKEGETVVLTGSISGFDGYEVMYQWMCDRGYGYEPVYGANDITYSFTATQESLNWSWELEVYYR